MKSLVFGTTNPHKLKELKALMPSSVTLLSMQEVGIDEELPEDKETILDNALQKANRLFELTNQNCFSEDTGLKVEALDGAPGVYSARYAGADRSSEANMNKLLSELKEKANRKAHFLTVIALHWEGGVFTFEGKVEGHISESARGTGGFGYDPIFVPEGYTKTFGELPPHVKHQISHRARAVGKLVDFLKRHV